MRLTPSYGKWPDNRGRRWVQVRASRRHSTPAYVQLTEKPDSHMLLAFDGVPEMASFLTLCLEAGYGSRPALASTAADINALRALHEHLGRYIRMAEAGRAAT